MSKQPPKAPDARPIETEVAWMMRDIENAKISIYGEGLMDFGLFVGQPRLLHLIRANDGSTQKQIAEMMRVSPSSLSMSIKRLEKQGLVIRFTPENDLRRNELHLTEKGIEVLRSCKHVIGDIHAKMLAGIDEDEKIILKNCLTRIMQNLEDHPLYSRGKLAEEYMKPAKTGPKDKTDKAK